MPPPMGAQVPSGHRSAPTEPAGETVSRRWRDGRSIFPRGSHPLPPPAPMLFERGSRTGAGGDFNFQNNIKFCKGALPPCTPKGMLSSVSPFYVVFLGSGTCLPHWGRCHRWAMTEGVLPEDPNPPPLTPPAHALFGRRKPRWRGRGRLFYTSHFKGGAGAPPLEPPKRQGRSETPPVAFGDSPLGEGASLPP